AGELQRVADEVRDAVVDLGSLVVVRQDHRVALLLQRVDGGHIGREERPLDRRHHVRDALVEVGGLALDLGVPFERAPACGGRWGQGLPCGERAYGFEDWHENLPCLGGWSNYTQNEYNGRTKIPGSSAGPNLLSSV